MKSRALLVLPALVLLVGCSNLGQAPTPLPTVVLGNQNATSPTPAVAAESVGGVTASGVVVPSVEVHLAANQQEVVKSVTVVVGDQVKSGQVLLLLDDSLMQAQIQQAQAAVVTAQANYDLLAAGPTAEQLRQASAAVMIATAAYSRTISGPRSTAISAAQAALTAAVDAYNKLKAGPQPGDYAAAEAAYRNAQAALQQAQAAYDAAHSQNPAGIGASPQALALQQATNNFNAAKAAYDKLAQPADVAQLSGANQQVQAARAALDAAVNPARDFDIVQAMAGVDQAQSALDALKAGPRKQQLDAARAQVDAAKAGLSVLQAQVQKYSLVAPLDGVVLTRTIQPGETAQLGSSLLVLAPLDHLRVETTDLSELDVPHVTKGQAVTVNVKALNQNVNGHVSDISPVANTLGGDVVYRTTVDLDQSPAGLRVGMTVKVQFNAP